MSSPKNVPEEPPPPYADASDIAAPPPPPAGPSNSSTLQVPTARNGIPAQDRRSMEDESRELPFGWVRQYDSTSHHQFFVDTAASPPRSIWHHPYDDETYLSGISSSERERIHSLHQLPEDDYPRSSDEHDHSYPELPPRENDGDKSTGLGSKIKNKLTGTTHSQRVAERRLRDEREAAAYRRHQHIRAQMSLAYQTGQPQLLGKNKDGQDVYIEPPGGPGGYQGGGGFGGGATSYGYNPYTQGPYSNPNAKFIRPQQPYGRPYPGYGYGYGGGYGMPLAGLGGGLLLGSLLF